MKKVLFLLLAISYSAFSQTDKIDSLMKRLDVVPDKEKPEVLNHISECIVAQSGEKAIAYSDKAFLLAQKYKNNTESGKALFNKSNAYFQMQKFAEAADYAVEAIKSFSLSQNNEMIARSYMFLGQIYRDKKDYSQSLKYINTALNKFIEDKDTLGMSDAYTMLGTLHHRQYLYTKAIESFTNTYQLVSKRNDKLKTSSVLCSIAMVYRDNGNYQKALENLSEAVFLLNSESHAKERADVLNLIGSLYLKTRQFENALEYYTKSLGIRKELKLEADIASIYINIGLVYREKNMPTEALQYFINALEIRRKQNDQKAIIASLNHIGGYYLNLKMFNEALRYYLDVLKHSIQYEDKKEMANALANIATINIEQSNFKKAVDYLEYALKLNLQFSDYSRLGTNYILLGNAYLNMKEYMTALQSYEEALAYRQKIGDESQVAATLINIGMTYQSWGKFKKALESFNQSLEKREKIKDYNGMAISLNHLGNLFLENKDTNIAVTYFEKSATYAEQSGNKYQNSLCLRKIGEILLARKQTAKAFPYLDKSLKLGNDIFNLELQRRSYLALHQYYSLKKEYKQALDNYKHYSLLSDSIYNRMHNQYLMEKQIEAELNIKDKKIKDFEYELQNLRAEDQLKALQLKRQQNIIVFIALIGLLFIVIGLIAYRAYHYKKQLNSELRKHLNNIETANNLLRESEDELRRLNSTKDKFFSIIAHDLRNSLNGILSLTKLLIDEPDQQNSSRKEVYELLHDASVQLYALLTNLLEWSRSQTGRIAYNPTVFDIFEMTNDNRKLLQLNADTKNISLGNKIMPQTMVYADKDMVNTVLRNLISNAIKFTPEKGAIMVLTEINDNEIVVAVEDNGVGMSEENMKNIFRIEKQYTTPGTNKEAGTGLGLILCKELVEKNKGEIWIESELGRGSRFKFTLPRTARG